MENQSNSKQDCGCSDGCCTPQKKSSLLKRLLFIAIILAATAIVAAKLVGNRNTPSENCCPAESATCCPQPNAEE